MIKLLCVRPPAWRLLSTRMSTQASGGGSQTKPQGEWVRPDSKHRYWIGRSPEFPPEAGRYHLFIANNCPWCHRTALTRAILGLQDAISLDVLFYRRDPDRGWQFDPAEEGCSEDSAAGGIKYIRELYKREGSAEKSVPVLYDKKSGKIVSNESADIIRMFALDMKQFHRQGAPELYPSALSDEIEAINSDVYDNISNGAYKAGFAGSQEAYEAAYLKFFDALDSVEMRLSKSRYLLGDSITEADIRLFPAIFRFDHVYYVRFKLNKSLIVHSYPSLQEWMMRLYRLPGIAQASNIRHCKNGYFGRTGNNIVPLGPSLGYTFDQ